MGLTVAVAPTSHRKKKGKAPKDSPLNDVMLQRLCINAVDVVRAIPVKGEHLCRVEVYSISHCKAGLVAQWDVGLTASYHEEAYAVAIL